MKNNKTIRYVLGGVIALMVVFSTPISRANAATEFMTSWQANTYTPAWYTGKALPTYQSFITVGFELIEDGKVVDLSKTAVRWYVDDKLFKNERSGLGIKKATVYNKKYGGDVSSIKISLPNYKGSILEKTIDIPVKKPEVVLDVPFFEKRLPEGDNFIFAWPFYFNVPSVNTLGLQWSAENGAVQVGRIGEAFKLIVNKDVVPGTKYTVKAMVGNLRKVEESATQSMIVETL